MTTREFEKRRRGVREECETRIGDGAKGEQKRKKKEKRREGGGGGEEVAERCKRIT